MLNNEPGNIVFIVSKLDFPFILLCFLLATSVILFFSLLPLSLPALLLHLSYCKQLTKAWQSLCSCSPCFSLSVLPAICYCLLAIQPVCLYQAVFIPFFFSSASEKQKLIKYGMRWSSISLNHHVIKTASLGDQLKRRRRTMSSQSDIYGPSYVNMFPLFSMYISCNYHFL